MNITKTNMLLLDNRIKKDDSDEKNTTSSTVTTTVEPQAGMKALTFQGLQNLMANPALAEKVGMNNSDIAFKAAPANALKTIGMAAVLAGALGLTSCTKEKIYPNPTNITIESNVKQEVNLNELIAAINNQNATLLQMLLNQQISLEEYKAQSALINGWLATLSGQVGGLSDQLANITNILNVIANNTFAIKDGVTAIYDDNNVFHQSAIALLTQAGYDRAEAINIFNKFYAEVVAGNKTAADAYAELIKLAQERNAKLDTIIGKMDAAFEQRNTQIDLLNKLLITGEATEEAVKTLNTQITVTNNTMAEIGGNLLNQLKNMDQNNTYWMSAIAYLAQQNNCSQQQIISMLQQLGITVNNINSLTPEQLEALLEGVINAINNQTSTINGFQNDVNNYAENVLNELQGLRAQICSLMSMVAKYGNAVLAKFGNVEALLKQTNIKLDDIKGNTADIKTAISQMKALIVQLNEYAKNISQNGGGMTAAEFKQILKEQRVEDYNFLTNLLGNLNIPSTEFDTKPIEALLAEISAKLDYQAKGVDILNKILALCEQYPDKMDEIKQAIIDKQFIFNCCCQDDCDHDDGVHEGILNYLMG